MKILVGVKRVVDYAVKVRVSNKTIDLSNTKMSMNPFCEIAVEQAVRLKESGDASHVTAVSMGPEACKETLRTALAMGCDDAIHVVTKQRTDTELQPYAISQVFQQLVDQHQPDLVLLGKQGIDGDCGQTGPMLAGRLGWPQVTFLSSLSKNDSHTLQAERETDAGTETFSVQLPAVMTCDLRLAEPRYATLPNIMKAKKKPMELVQADSLGIELEPRVQVVEIQEPPQRQAGILVNSVDELVDKLKNEAQVI